MKRGDLALIRRNGKRCGAAAANRDDDELGLDGRSFGNGDGRLRCQLLASYLKEQKYAICGTDPFTLKKVLTSTPKPDNSSRML